MFDKISVVRSETEYVPYAKTVNVNRAPTDDSIRLLNELQEKATKNIIDRISVQDNEFSYFAQSWRDHLRDNILIGYKFTLNGKEHMGEIAIPAWKYSGKRELIGAVVDAATSEITKLLLQKIKL